MARLGSAPPAAVLVGDSATDIRAARAVQITSVGYANRPGKIAAFEQASADAIISTMTELLPQLRGGAG